MDAEATAVRTNWLITLGLFVISLIHVSVFEPTSRTNSGVAAYYAGAALVPFLIGAMLAGAKYGISKIAGWEPSFHSDFNWSVGLVVVLFFLYTLIKILF
jgi:hypothetical protein